MNLRERQKIQAIEKKLSKLKTKVEEQERTIMWMREQMRTGMKDIIERVVRETVEVDIQDKSTTEQLKDLFAENKEYHNA